MITPDEIKKYTVTLNVTGDWVSFRHPLYPPQSASLAENRYNHAGATAYYLASGYDTAKLEVPDWECRHAYKVSPTTINTFNLAQWAQDNGRYEEFLKSKTDGGYGLCQSVADHLTGIHGLSGIMYPSAAVHASGGTGFSCVILPASGQVVGDTFFAKDLGFNPGT